MNIHQIRDLALKILGIYYLSRALIYAPQVSSFFLSWDNNPSLADNKLAIGLSGLLPLVFWLLIGLVLTFRTGHVAKILWLSRQDSEARTIERPSLRFWIVLIGFFFLVSSTGGVVSHVLAFVANRNIRDPFIYYQYLPEIFTLVLSIICIFKARGIEAWLKTKIGDDSQQGHLQRPADKTSPGA
jgi:hypothetical protein